MTVRRTEYVSLRIDPDLAAEIHEFAGDHGLDRSEAIRLLTARGLAADDSSLSATDKTVWSSSTALRSMGPGSYAINATTTGTTSGS